MAKKAKLKKAKLRQARQAKDNKKRALKKQGNKTGSKFHSNDTWHCSIFSDHTWSEWISEEGSLNQCLDFLHNKLSEEIDSYILQENLIQENLKENTYSSTEQSILMTNHLRQQVKEQCLKTGRMETSTWLIEHELMRLKRDQETIKKIKAANKKHLSGL